MRLVGRYLEQTGETAAEYLEWLEETPIEALSQGEQREENVAHLLEHSLAQVNETAQQVLAVAGVLALASFDRAVIMAALDLSAGEVRRALNQLVSYGLLQREEGRFVVSHALIHTYARRRLSVESEVIQRVAEYYADLVEAQGKLGSEGYARLDAERIHIVQIITRCAATESWSEIIPLIRAVQNYLSAGGHLTDWMTVLEIGISVAKITNDLENEGRFFGNLGIVYREMSQSNKAIRHLERARDIALEINDKYIEAYVTGNLGVVYLDLGQIQQAIEYFHQTLDLSREVGNRELEGSTFDSLGFAYRSLRQLDKSIDYHKQALVVAQELNNKHLEGHALNNLGLTYSNLKLNQTNKAIEYHEKALTIMRENGDRGGEGTTLGRLGGAYRILGQTKKAIKFFEQALAISQELNREGLGAHWLIDLGIAHNELGHVEQGIAYLEQGLAIVSKAGYQRKEWRALNNLGIIYQDLEKFDKAIAYFEQALAIDRELGDWDYTWSMLNRIGHAHRQLGRYDLALSYFDQALELRPNNDWAHYQRGLIYLIRDETSLTHQAITHAIEMARPRYEDNPQNWRNTFQLALYRLVNGETKTARQLYQEAIIGQPPQSSIREAADDVTDFLRFFPDHAQAQTMLELLQEGLG